MTHLIQFSVVPDDESILKQRVCCNCGNCQRIQKKTSIETRCAIDNHYIGYLECFSDWCRHWKRERKWDKEQEIQKSSEVSE